MKQHFLKIQNHLSLVLNIFYLAMFQSELESFIKSFMNTLPMTIISTESGGSCGQLHYDYAVSYTFFDYFYPDLFLLESDTYTNFDQITDSKLNFTLGLKYLLK